MHTDGEVGERRRQRTGDAMHEAADKVARIVEALGTPSFEARALNHVAAVARVSRSATYRILKTLEAREWVRFDAQADTWSLDGGFTRFGIALMRHLDSRQQDLDEEHARLIGGGLR